MALHDPQNTLAYNGSRVLCQHRDMRSVPCKAVAEAATAWVGKAGKVTPETDALWFYGMNHGLALIAAERAPLEPLEGFDLLFVQTYHQELGPRALRAFYYLLAICTREFRHCKNMDAIGVEIGVKFNPAIMQWLQGGGGEDTIWAKFQSTPPDCPIGAYVSALRWGFYNGAWGGGYGGAAWGKVTDCLERFVTGEYTAEMMLDTVWTLCHNNGPIFNKPLLYDHYGDKLVQLLDVQRSGQVPAMILENYLFTHHTPLELRSLMAKLQQRFPGKVASYVDWYVVEALGSVGKYPQAKVAQVKKHGASPMAAELDALQAKTKAAAAAKAKAEAEAVAAKVQEMLKDKFEVMPGVVVQKTKMKRAA